MEKQEYEKSILEYEGVKDAVECAREDGEREGFEKGIEEGIERGIKKGIEKGREEGREEGVVNERTKLILSMFSNGMDVNTISKMTGLTKEMVEDLIE